MQNEKVVHNKFNSYCT